MYLVTMNLIKLGLIGTVIVQNIKLYETNTEKISLSKSKSIFTEK